MNKPRLEAYTDAVIAIAATIMVLELHAPEEVSIHALLKLWPTFISYTISFSLIYVVWYSHHNLFRKAKVVTPKVFILNGLWLFILTLAPFMTSWVGEHPNDTLPEFSYAFLLFLWALAFQFMDIQVLRDNPTAKKDTSTTLVARTFLYSTEALAMLLSFWIPVVTLLLLSVTTVSSVIGVVRNPVPAVD